MMDVSFLLYDGSEQADPFVPLIGRCRRILKALQIANLTHIRFRYLHITTDEDVTGLAGFIPIAEYRNDEIALPNEIGKCECFRFFRPLEQLGAR